MRGEVYLPRPTLRYVGVYLRRGKVGVPQQFLYHLKVGPAVEQVRGECMAQYMGMDAFVNIF